MGCNQDLNPHTMCYLQDMLLLTNWYKQIFLHAFEILENTPSRDLRIRILANPSTDLQCYNIPSVNEIAVILPGIQSHAQDACDIILHHCRGDLQFIHDHHHAYAPLHYVLLFPHGTPGWTYSLHVEKNAHITSQHDQATTKETEKYITQVKFYSYCLHMHNNKFPTLQCGGRLFQQYIYDMWVSTDQNRLQWIENH
jgi:hypothetical protein